MLLAGDIGGTKTALALFSEEEGPHRPLVEQTYPSADYSSLEAIVADFTGSQRNNLQGACFGVAGPVQHGRVQVTNLPWLVDGQALSQALAGVQVTLLNDLEAVAGAIPILERSDLATLQPGNPVANGPIAVVAPGTGLGEAFLVWDGRRYRAYPSEGGHTDFAPTNALQIKLLQYLMTKFDRVSYERVCSGIGVPNIYNGLLEIGAARPEPAVAGQVNQAPDPTPVIFNAALSGACDLCRATLQMFVTVLAAEAGNLALKVLATGGVYLGGGIPPRILPQLQAGPFMNAFSRKGRFKALLNQIPVHVILQPKTALFGAAYRAISDHQSFHRNWSIGNR
jgi:glucokinase